MTTPGIKFLAEAGIGARINDDANVGYQLRVGLGEQSKDNSSKWAQSVTAGITGRLTPTKDSYQTALVGDLRLNVCRKFDSTSSFGLIAGAETPFTGNDKLEVSPLAGLRFNGGLPVAAFAYIPAYVELVGSYNPQSGDKAIMLGVGFLSY